MRLGNANDFFRACQVLCLIGVVLVVGCYIFGRIALNTPKTDYTTTPLSLSEFYRRSHHGGLPVTATNLFFASAQRGFVGFVDMYRFDAPAADCISYGKRFLQQFDKSQTPDLTPLKTSPKPIGSRYLEAMGLSKVDWFDVETIQSGFEGHREPSQSGRPGMTFWIDTNRGRFYFYSSD